MFWGRVADNDFGLKLKPGSTAAFCVSSRFFLRTTPCEFDMGKKKSERWVKPHPLTPSMEAALKPVAPALEYPCWVPSCGRKYRTGGALNKHLKEHSLLDLSAVGDRWTTERWRDFLTTLHFEIRKSLVPKPRALAAERCRFRIPVSRGVALYFLHLLQESEHGIISFLNLSFRSLVRKSFSGEICRLNFASHSFSANINNVDFISSLFPEDPTSVWERGTIDLLV
jgi:hypothetical protein